MTMMMTREQVENNKYNLRGADLREADLYGADLRGADLRDADLRGADLRGADLRDADLRGADLRGANLRGANLRGAKLCGANLRGANFCGANLCGANLRGANFCGANLYGANLRDADLRDADLYGADLREADLYGADLREANLRGANLHAFQIPQDGTLTVWKILKNGLCKLEIPAEAKRTASLVGRKCRAEYAKVLWIENPQTLGDILRSAIHKTRRIDYSRRNNQAYVEGEMVYPDKYNDDIRVECSHGIHFFLTREEAENY